MGLILPQTVKVKTSMRTYKYYREKGYEFEKYGDFIEVNVLDLPKGSKYMVKIVCDICGKEREMQYRTVVKFNEENKLITCGSNSCRNKKYEDTCMKKYSVKNVNQLKTIKDKKINTCRKKYGVDNPGQSQEVKDKKKKTCQIHLGVDNPFESKEIQDKIKGTWQKNYGEGIINPFQAESVRDKIKKTWQENYGEGIINPFQAESVREKSQQTLLKNYRTDNPFKSKEIQDKIKNTWQKNYGENITNPMQVESIKDKIKTTCRERYGADNAMQNEEIKNKVLDSFQFNHTGPSSRAQRYINYILNGTLNKRICGSLADIYIEKENIIIEHDGSGHFLGDIINGNKTPTKESLSYEKEREDKIINNGYRMIRFIATKDRIPSDEVILNLIEGFKNSDFKVIRINFEEGTIDRDYEERWYCNFGELRKITQKDLEQFEK